jgi:hypothetical protein
MSERKKNKLISDYSKLKNNELSELIKNSVEGLWYMSETDAEIFLFVGKEVESVTKENLLLQIGKPLDSPIEERNFAELFDRLTKIREWFGDSEKGVAEKFSVLRNLLETKLKDLKVFKVGHIQLDIYIVGIDAEGNLIGIQTRAVET